MEAVIHCCWARKVHSTSYRQNPHTFPKESFAGSEQVNIFLIMYLEKPVRRQPFRRSEPDNNLIRPVVIFTKTHHLS